jgi:hypothetical protein
MPRLQKKFIDEECQVGGEGSQSDEIESENDKIAEEEMAEEEPKPEPKPKTKEPKTKEPKTKAKKAKEPKPALGGKRKQLCDYNGCDSEFSHQPSMSRHKATHRADDAEKFYKSSTDFLLKEYKNRNPRIETEWSYNNSIYPAR